MNAPRALDVTLRRPLRLVLLAVVLALSVAGHAHALVTVNAATFLADCVSPITVTQDTRVTRSATVTNSCTIDVDPGVTLEFSSAIITAPDLSIVGGIGATVRLVTSLWRPSPAPWTLICSLRAAPAASP